MKIKLLRSVLTICMILPLFVLAVCAADSDWTVEPFTYNGVEGVAVTGYSGTQSDIYIPAKIDGKTVLKVGDNLLAGSSSVNSVTMANGIKVIGDGAFSGASGMVCALLPEDIEIIGANAFSNNAAFNSVILYDSLVQIGDRAFSGCPEVTVYCNEDTVGHTYAESVGLNFVILNPSAVPETITVDGLTYYIHDGQAALVEVDASLTEVVVPAVVNEVPVTDIRTAFRGHTKVTSVTLPSNIKKIPDEAFMGCSAMTTIVVPDGVTEIGERAYSAIRTFKKIVIPASVEKIGKDAFYSNGYNISYYDICITDLEAWCNIEFVNEYSNPSYRANDTFYIDNLPTSEIVIPDGITAIKDYAFYTFEKMTSVSIPGSVTSIGNSAFSSCTNLEAVTLSEGIESIETEAFRNCKSIKSLEIPGSVVSIGTSAFDYCSNLESIVFSEGLETIESYAFANSPLITSITLPESVVSIGSSAFAASENLKPVIIPKNTSITINGEYSSFAENTALLVYEGSTLANNKNDYLILAEDEKPLEYTQNGITYLVVGQEASVVECDPELTEVNIESEIDGYPVTSVRSAFYKNENITKVTLPDSIKKIGKYSFYGCSNLVNINLPQEINHIGEYAFYSCSSLTSVDIPDNITSMERYVFYNCTALTSICIPGNVTTIKDRAFGRCTALETVNFSEGLLSLESYAFSNCTELTSINLPSTLTKIDANHVFDGCYKLEPVVIPKKVSSYFTYSFSDNTVLLVYEGSRAHYYAQEDDMIYLVIKENEEPLIYNKDGITYIIKDNEAIAVGCDFDLTEAVVADSVEGYPVTSVIAAFYSRNNLTKVSLPETITEIGKHTFYACNNLTTVNIPQKVTSIGKYAFYNCTSLVNIDIPDAVSFIGEYAFYTCKSLASINIPDGLTSIESWCFYECDSLTSIDIPSSVTTIKWNAFYSCSKLSSITLHEGLEKIESYAFNYCPVVKLEVPKTVISIGFDAFYGCSKLESLILHEGLQSIDRYTFSSCSSLTSVEIPSTVTSIADDTFGFCSKLKTVTLHEGLISIGRNAFRRSPALTSINFPSTLTSIGEAAFESCTNLRDVVLPDKLESIGNNAFYDCDSITNIEIPGSVTSIGESAFYSCDYLKNVVLNDGITEIKTGAFNGCAKLKTMYIPDSITSLEAKFAPATTILLVNDGSYAHTYAAENDFLYFVLKKAENPEIAFGTEISGNVKYSDGTPAKGVTVSLIYDDGTPHQADVKTDSNGTYTFAYAEVGKYTVKAVDDIGRTALSSGSIRIMRKNVFEVMTIGRENGDLVLKKGNKVSGTVTPAEATVEICLPDGSVPYSAETVDGTFEFPDVPNGEYVIRAMNDRNIVAVELNVFNRDVFVTLVIPDVPDGTVTIMGDVDIMERDHSFHKKEWATVWLIDEKQDILKKIMTDKNGHYSFTGLSTGNYTVVAFSSELRDDKKYNGKRPHDLYGFAYVTAPEPGEYIADILLSEEREAKGVIEGQAVAHGGPQICDVVLESKYHGEIASYKTNNNGKFRFENIPDGVYKITASCDVGSGCVFVTVDKGMVYGKIKIIIEKSSVHSEHEGIMMSIPECDTREAAIEYKDTIQSEKQFYDSLSDKEKKQLSKSYTDKLDKLIALITEYDLDNNEADGASIENLGMIISGDEIANGEAPVFKLTVEKKEAHKIGEDGISTDEDYYQVFIVDAADGRELAQYYDISLVCVKDDIQHEITDIKKDTDTTGKLKLILPIPEEYRGHVTYSVIHLHNGTPTVLTDIDSDPDTITVEVDKFSTFVLAFSDEEIPEIPEITVPAQFSYESGMLTATATVDGARFYVAQYDESGRMISVKVFDLTKGIIESTYFDKNQKAFILDEKLNALCEEYMLD